MKRLLIGLLLMVSMPATFAFAQDDDLDNIGESSTSIDDLDSELDQIDSPSSKVSDDELSSELDDPEESSEKPAEAVVEKAPEPEPQPEIVPPPEEELREEIAAPEPDATPDAIPVAQPEPQIVAVEDVPDAEFEARMGRIFKQFYSGKISDSEWFQIIGVKGTEKYSVQAGDTLWGISTTFFGNGFFWPKLWQLNSDYTNPHVLEPGQSIGFSPGSTAVEPSVNLTKGTYAFNTEPDVPFAAVTPEQAKAYSANAEIPPPMVFRPVLKKIPNSIPNWTQGSQKYDSSGFSIGAKKRFDVSETTLVPSFISDVFPDNVGQVVEVETGGDTANLYQEVILELDGAAEGEFFTVFKVIDRISNSWMSTSGYPVEYQGEVEILEGMGDDRYRAIVYNLVSPVEKGSRVRKGTIPITSFSKSGRPATASVNVVGGQFDAERRLMATNTVVYLDGGTEDGIQEGDMLSILKNQKVRNPDTIDGAIKEPVALIKIIHTSQKLSTGMVIDARGEIRPGDKTGPSERYKE
jgi:hypothetical protein